MPIRPPVSNPPFNVVRASHVELSVRDLSRARAFYVDCLGYLVSGETQDTLYLRAVEERNHHSIVLRKAAEPRCGALGFKLASEDDLDRAAHWFGAKGLPTAFRETAHQGRTLRTSDPVGIPLEFYFKMNQGERMLQKYAAYQGARIQRIDHLNCFTPDVQASYEFYTEFGFRLTEYTETDGADPKLWAVWLHRKGNVHDLAFTNGRGPRLHHVGVWNATSLDILHICDVMATSGYLANMERGPGRHGISNAFFLYIRDPDGHRIELFSSDYLTVDPDLEPLRWSLDDPQRQTLWGHPAPKSWFEEGTEFSGVAVRDPNSGGKAGGGKVSMKTIFIDCNEQLGAVWKMVYRADDPPVTINTTPFERDDLPKIVGDYEVVIDDHSYMPTNLVKQCKSLKHIVFLGTGAASYMNVAELEKIGVKVHTIMGYGDTAVAEQTIALMFAAARDLARMDRNIRGGMWRPREGVQLKDKTLGIIGLGGIGAEVARIARGIGMDVIAWNRTPRPDSGVPQVELDALLAKSDVVSLNLTLSDETRGFLDAKKIARMKRGVILVNTARGALVDEHALLDALRSGHIRHAGFDVFHNEPLKADNPLAIMDGTTLSAHAAFRTLEASMTLLRRAIDIVKSIQS